jgi:hypothetical protein
MKSSTAADDCERLHIPQPVPLLPSSAEQPPPWPPRLLQFHLETGAIGVQFGMTISHGLQFVEHGGHIPRHANLIGLGPRFLQFVL